MVALSVALVLVLSLGVGCRRQPTPPGEPNEESDGQEETPGETEEQFFCPLDGLPVTDPELVERRPLAVMIGNIPGLAELQAWIKPVLCLRSSLKAGLPV